MRANPKTLKALAGVCSPDLTRPVLMNARYSENGEPGFLVGRPTLAATNGHILAVIPVEKSSDEAPAALGGEDTNGALIPAAVLKKAQPFHKRLFDGDAIIAANGTIRTGTIDATTESPAPDHSIQDFPTLSTVAVKGETVFRFSLNAELLATLAKALTAGKPFPIVTLEFITPEKAARVKGANGAVGLIMPCRVKDSE